MLQSQLSLRPYAKTLRRSAVISKVNDFTPAEGEASQRHAENSKINFSRVAKGEIFG